MIPAMKSAAGPVIAVLLTAASASAAEPPAEKTPAGPAWLPKLADGYTQAGRRGQPVLVRVGSPSCLWCRKLEAELRGPIVAMELERCSLVALDMTEADRDARVPAVGPIPAPRVLSATCQIVASHDGFLPVGYLTEWLLSTMMPRPVYRPRT